MLLVVQHGDTDYCLGNNDDDLAVVDDDAQLHSRDLFLTPDERFEVYMCKCAERPYLLHVAIDEGEEEDSQEEQVLPLVDGCDIPGWRFHRLVAPLPAAVESVLRVGCGCSLLRREAQWPVLPTIMKKHNCTWERLREMLLNQPVTAGVARVHIVQASSELTWCGSGSTRTVKHFSKWEHANVPVIIDGCTTTHKWDLDAWKLESLLGKYGHVRWRFSDTHGAVVALDTYHKYTNAVDGALTDDAPLGIYDSEFGDDDSPLKPLTQAYTVPPCFSDDLFALAVDKDNAVHDNGSRPPWRWILMGPPRSGTGLHIDPIYTNAWVTLLQGQKRWILMPPDLLSRLPEGAGLVHPQVPSVIWFRDFYNDAIALPGVVEILQQPGETVFVPQGWPHLVLNLEFTIAVTHNYASEFGPFERMWQEVVKEEPDFARRWYSALVLHRPDLAKRIDAFSSDLDSGPLELVA